MLQMLLTSLLILAVGGMTATRIAQVQRVPGVLLVPAVLVLMTVGVFVINGRTVDLWIMLAAGLAGYLLEKLKVPLAPMVLGMILGPMAEQNRRPRAALRRRLRARLPTPTPGALPRFRLARKKKANMSAAGPRCVACNVGDARQPAMRRTLVSKGAGTSSQPPFTGENPASRGLFE